MTEELKGKKFPVLDHGHVILVDYMGCDADIVQAARTSYQKGTTHTSDDRTLIRYLMRHRHSSPIECCTIKLHIKLPIFVERQWARHRTAGFNEVSARYSELPEEYYIPEEEDVQAQSNTNRQGRGDGLDTGVVEEFLSGTKTTGKEVFERYHEDLNNGVARELARINLPLGTYTEKVWWCNLYNVLHFLSLRMDSHAQWEIRQYANIIGNEIIKPLFPAIWEAFEDYRLNSMQLTALDVGVIQRLTELDYNKHTPFHDIDFMDCQDPSWKGLERCRERDECLVKLINLGLVEGDDYVG